MTVNIQYVQMDTSESMSNYVTEKLKRLGEKFELIIKSEVHFKHENHLKERGKICSIELSIPGPRLFATSNEKNYEMAVKETINDLEIQLKKRKQVFNTHL